MSSFVATLMLSLRRKSDQEGTEGSCMTIWHFMQSQQFEGTFFYSSIKRGIREGAIGVPNSTYSCFLMAHLSTQWLLVILIGFQESFVVPTPQMVPFWSLLVPRRLLVALSGPLMIHNWPLVVHSRGPHGLAIPNRTLPWKSRVGS